MFYSQCLLSRKGPFGGIWVAAYYVKRLTKRQITETDIPSSVDKILTDDWESVKYRILAYLLLGVVRIFSKKVDFMIRDCHGIINELNKFVANKRTVPFRHLVRLPEFTITLPRRYDLDAFTVEVPDDTDRIHVAEAEATTVREQPAESSKRNQISYKNHQAEDDEELHEEQEKQRAGSSSSKFPKAADKETSSTALVSSETFIPPDRVEADMELDSPEELRNLDESTEELRGIRFSNEECLDFEAFFEQNEAECLKSVKSSSNVVRSVDEQADELHEIPSENNVSVSQAGKEVTVEECQDQKSSDSPEQVTAHNQDVCFTIEGTPEARLPNVLTGNTGESKTSKHKGSVMAEQLDVQTPAVNEQSRKRRKSVVMYDNYIGLTNATLKRWTKDSSDLVRKRKKSARATWDGSKIFDNFSGPLVPWAVTELITPQKLKSKEADVAEASDSLQETIRTETDVSKPQRLKSVEIEMVDAPDTPPPEMGESSVAAADLRSVIAPRTPVLCPASPTRLFRSPQPLGSEMDSPAIPFVDATTEVNEEVALSDLMSREMVQNVEDEQGSDGWSMRTRTTARWLHQLLTTQKKRKRDKTVNLSAVLNGKARKESASLFYEILVLKSGGYVGVKQDEPYSDILVHETPKMINLGKCH